MGKCPYCSKELHIEDFFVIEKRETKRGKIKGRVLKFKGEEQDFCKMWVCPSCETILGFSDYNYA